LETAGVALLMIRLTGSEFADPNPFDVEANCASIRCNPAPDSDAEHCAIAVVALFTVRVAVQSVAVDVLLTST